MRIFSSKKRVGFLIAALIAAAILIPVVKTSAGWGPSRPTYTWAHPAKTVTFNSMTDNPVVGDERPFFAGKDAASGGNVVDKINVYDNEIVSLRVFYHNNAAENQNKVAKNTRVRIALPTKAATATWSTAHITADNATPADVADTVDFAGPLPFTLEYMSGSAQLWNNVFQGAKLSDEIVGSNGALIGFDKIDGKVPGCERFSGYVTVKVRVHMQKQPVYSCDALDVKTNGRKVDASVAYTATGGASFKSASFNWGDNSSPTVTSATTASHTYGADGNYTITATLTFDVGGTDQTASCTKQVSFSSTPVPPSTPPSTPRVGKAIPDTGAGSVAGIFAGVSAIAGAAHYMWTRRFGA